MANEGLYGFPTKNVIILVVTLTGKGDNPTYWNLFSWLKNGTSQLPSVSDRCFPFHSYFCRNRRLEAVAFWYRTALKQLRGFQKNRSKENQINGWETGSPKRWDRWHITPQARTISGSPKWYDFPANWGMDYATDPTELRGTRNNH